MNMITTNIQHYYSSKNIFITGATGVIGRTLVEKLLRSCSNLNKIILPIRSKKGLPFEQRKADYFNNDLFNKIKENDPNIFNKVLFFEINLGEDKIGLNENDYKFVISSVNIIIHCAATVNFNGPLHEAILSNIISTKNLIKLAKNVENLEVFVHISTLWSHATVHFQPEKVIHNSYDPEFLIHLFENVDRDCLKAITPNILGNWPNTYLFTKHASEVLVDREKDKLPIVIFRVPAVGPTYHEPISGWLIEMQGLTALGIGLASGFIKVINVRLNATCDTLPADYVINCIIASVWRRANQNGNELKVYNFGSALNNVTRRKYFDAFVNTKYPLECTVRAPGYINVPSDSLYNKYDLLYQQILARISDVFRILSFQKPKYKKLINYNQKLLDSVSWFLSVEFTYEYDNILSLLNMLSEEDKQIFYFDIRNINWDDYYDLYCKSVKSYLKEDFNKLHECEVNRYMLKCKL